jgi:hypothetical protein
LDVVDAVGQVIERRAGANAKEFGDEKGIGSGDELGQSGAAKALWVHPGRPEHVGGVRGRDGFAGHLGPAVHQYVRIRSIETVAVFEGALQGGPSGGVEWNGPGASGESDGVLSVVDVGHAEMAKVVDRCAVEEGEQTDECLVGGHVEVSGPAPEESALRGEVDNGS